MPKQETFLLADASGATIEVLKTYDRSYAREVFIDIGEDARKNLASALEIDAKYDQAEIPDPGGQEYQDFLWEELCEASLEDVRQSPKLYSFFVVTETKSGRTGNLYVSPDWPSAENFAKGRIAAAQ